MSKLTDKSCQWAIDYILQKGDTDLFPRAFELDVIKSFPEDIKKLLQKTDIGAYQWNDGRHTIVPKDTLLFRSATQLDPLDSLFLSALIYEFGYLIEQARIPFKDDIVFSYRFMPTTDGKQLYDREGNWNSFWANSVEKAKAVGGWVVVTDVSNYYNQIYHHTIENMLIEAKVPKEVISSIKNCLQHLTQGVSRGIPVGPHAAHLIAECAFDPIDRSMRSRGYVFNRYVDDIHIFCRTRSDALIAIYDLVEVLDRQQRLTLQRHKTKILSVEEFTNQADLILLEKPLTNLEKEIITIIERHSNMNPYESIHLSLLSEIELNVLNQLNIEKIFEAYVSQEEPDFTRISWLFRRLAQTGIPHAIPFAINNLEKLSPALPAIGNYLMSTKYNFTGDWKSLGEGLLQTLQLPLVQHSEYLSLVLLDFFVQLPDLNHIENLLQMYNTTFPMAKRKIVRVATKHKAHYWLREQKVNLAASDVWLKRAFIAGASAFSKDERDFWLKLIDKRPSNEFEKLIIKWAKTNE